MFGEESTDQELKKKIFYLIHESTKGLTLDRLISLSGINEKKVKEFIALLEEEAMIYLDEKVYASFFNEEYLQQKQKEKIENSHTAWKYDKVVSNTADNMKLELCELLTAEELAALIEQKKEELKGLISDEGALFIIYKERGLDNRKEEETFYGQSPFYSNPVYSDMPKTQELISTITPRGNTLTTGSSALDQLLGGGLQRGSVYEIFGTYRMGKTQLAHQLCVNVQLPQSKGGLEGNALYIDTEGTFSPERLQEMIYAVDLKCDEALKNIVYGRAYNSDHQMLLLDELEPIIKEKNVKVIAIDSLVGHFISEYSLYRTEDGKVAQFSENYFTVNSLLRMFLSRLHQLALDYNVIVYFTYYTEAITDSKLGNPFKPTRGTIVAQEHHTRLFIRKGKGDTRVARLLHSPHNLPLAEVQFFIHEDGIRD